MQKSLCVALISEWETPKFKIIAETPSFSSLCFNLQAEIFQEFSVQEESVMFRISLSVLLDCLTIFGTSSLPGVVYFP